MAITRSKSQQYQTLTEFYTVDSENDKSTIGLIGTEMLKWINRINSELPNIKIWGLTNDNGALILMDKETSESHHSVIIFGFKGYYNVKYLMPKKDAPWKNAYIQGETSTFEEAIEMTIIGIEKSGAWNNS